eukprot:NP_490709.1 Uncharacterized protein CELE_C53D5.2 [Caenorhabditis elegans]
MAQDGDRHHIFVSAPPPPPPSSSIPAPSQPNRLEKEPLIDEETDMIDESRATYWKGCEFLKASGLYSSKCELV